MVQQYHARYLTQNGNWVLNGLEQEMGKSLKVDRKKFEGIVKNLLDSPPVKREDVKVSKKKPGKLLPPQES
jgi:hypothetical protein